MSYNLFLDDVRDPYSVGNYISAADLIELYRHETWSIVRSYDEFVKCIQVNEVPALVSFDHDLADEHYRPIRYQTGADD